MDTIYLNQEFTPVCRIASYALLLKLVHSAPMDTPL